MKPLRDETLPILGAHQSEDGPDLNMDDEYNNM